MPADFEKVERIRRLMSGDNQSGWVMQDHFSSFCEQVRLGAHLRKAEDPENAARLERSRPHLRYLLDDVMLLYGSLTRTQLDFERRIEGKLDDGLWFQFSRQDVEFFLLVMRSAMDHAASFIVSTAETDEWIKVDSFEKLRNKRKRDDAAGKLGTDWIELLDNCAWFEDLRWWRRLLAHKGGMAITFFDSETVLFQVEMNGQHKVAVREVMYNENVVDFARFAALYLSYFLCFLEDMAMVGKKRLDITRGRLPMTIHAGGGVQVFRFWSDRLMAMRATVTPSADL